MIAELIARVTAAADLVATVAAPAADLVARIAAHTVAPAAGAVMDAARTVTAIAVRYPVAAGVILVGLVAFSLSVACVTDRSGAIADTRDDADTSV